MKHIYTLLLLSITTFGQNWDEVIKAVASDREANDFFGFSVSIDGNKAIVGAQGEDVNTGAAYIFELNGGVWTETAKLLASDGDDDDGFGFSVSISGNKAIVGASLEDHDASGGAPLADAGSAYIFELSGGVWMETAKLVASDRGVNDRFALSVSINGDKAIVGAFLEDQDASGGASLSEAGAVYVFELSGGVWMETAKLVASDRGAYDRFGRGVSISGNKVIVGAYKQDMDASGGNSMQDAGAAYIFEFNGGIWTETTKLVTSDRAPINYFGLSVSISGDKAIVGCHRNRLDASGGNSLQDAGAAYVFELSGGVWSETTKLVASDRASSDAFGVNVSISGNKVVVGAASEDEDASGGAPLTDAGSAYIFELSGGVWSETTKLVASDRGAGDLFGRGVGISGNKVIVGAYREAEDVSGGNTLADAGSTYMFMTCPTLAPSVTVSGITATATIAGATYQWLDCDNGNAVISSETNQSYTATANGNYAVIVTENGCTDTSACVNIATVGINDLELESNTCQVFPNPVSSILSVNCDAKIKIKTIVIMDVMGGIVKTVTMSNNTIDVSYLTNGIYFLQVQTDKRLVNKKFIKK
jgi:hypothetical protein